MLKRTLIVIAVAVGVGCRDKKDQQLWMRNNDSGKWIEVSSNDSSSWVADSIAGAHLCFTSCQHTYKTIAIPLDQFGPNAFPPSPRIVGGTTNDNIGWTYLVDSPHITKDFRVNSATTTVVVDTISRFYKQEGGGPSNLKLGKLDTFVFVGDSAGRGGWPDIIHKKDSIPSQ